MKFAFTILILLCLFPLFAQETPNDTSYYQIIGDSVIMKDGTTCHIDNFEDGKCVDGWSFNFFNFWIGLSIPFLLFGYIALTVKRRINKKDT